MPVLRNTRAMLYCVFVSTLLLCCTCACCGAVVYILTPGCRLPTRKLTGLCLNTCAQPHRHLLAFLAAAYIVCFMGVGGGCCGCCMSEAVGPAWPFIHLQDTPGQVHLINGAVPGTFSSYMSVCYNVHVPQASNGDQHQALHDALRAPQQLAQGPLKMKRKGREDETEGQRGHGDTYTVTHASTGTNWHTESRVAGPVHTAQSHTHACCRMPPC